MAAIEEAATKEFEWGLKLANSLNTLGQWDTDIWPYLTRAWARDLGKDEHRTVLNELSYIELYANHAPAVADVLNTIVKDGGLPYAVYLLPEANQIAMSLWAYLDQNEPPLDTGDSFFDAINHPSGILTLFWLASFTIWRNHQDPRPDHLGNEYSSALFGIVQDKTRVGVLGKAVLARNLRFLLAADEKWTVRHLVPLFNQFDSNDYRAAWDGFLYGNLNPHVVAVLDCAFLDAVTHIRTIHPVGDKIRNQFIAFYTIILIYFVDHPLERWLPKFFENSEVEDVIHFAWCIGGHLKQMDDARRMELWDRWLKLYWQNRLQGVPIPIHDGEIDAMLEWLSVFGAVFPHVVEVAVQMHPAPLEETLVIYNLHKGDLWSKYPEATASLLVYLGDSQWSPWQDDVGKELIENLLKRDIPADLKAKLRELSAGQGL